MGNHYSTNVNPKLTISVRAKKLACRLVYCGEPSVEELLGDDGIRQLMACDGVAAEQLKDLMSQMRARLA